MKKTLLTACALIISAALLSACGSAAGENSAASSETAEAAAYSEAELTDTASPVSEDENLIPAEQEDLLGAWIESTVGVIFLFGDDCIDILADGAVFRSYAVVSGGETVSSGETQLSGCSFYLSGDELLYVPGSGCLSLERYDETVLTDEMLDGCRTNTAETMDYFSPITEDVSCCSDVSEAIFADDGYYLFDNNSFGTPSGTGSYTIDGQTITIPLDGKNAAYTYYICGDYLYLLGSEDYLAFYGVENKLRLME